MPFDQAVILHKVLTELHTGMLALAFMAAWGALIAPRGTHVSSSGKAADATFICASACGIVFLVFSASSGLLTWPWEKLWRTPLIYSKVSFFIFALTLWGISLGARLIIGSAVWNRKSGAAPMALSVSLAFISLVMTGSAGGHLGHGESLVNGLFGALDPYTPIVWAPPWSMGLLACGAAFLIYQLMKKEPQPMSKYAFVFFILLFLATAGLTKVFWQERPAVAQMTHKNHATTKSQPVAPATTQKSKSDSHQMHSDKAHPTKAPPSAKLEPAEGASVKILSPKSGQTFKGDQVPLQFKLVKGKRGHHVHAYVDNELMGMFESEQGTLTGIKPGSHVLELRVVAKDHQTELDARDRVKFMVK